MQIIYKNIGATKYNQKHWRIQKTQWIPKHWRLQNLWRMPTPWRIQNLWRMVKTWRIQNLWRMLKTWRIQNVWRMPKPCGIQNLWHLQKCWRSRKSRRTPWRIALLFRLVRICNCWLLSGPADGLVLLLAEVLNCVHVDSKWGMVPQCPAFMCGLSPVLYRLLVSTWHASKWSNLWRRPNLWRPPEISLISVKP